jgi:hypothetical protein
MDPTHLFWDRFAGIPDILLMRIIPGGVIKPAMGNPETIRVPVTVVEPAEFAEDPDHVFVIPVCRQDRRSGLLCKLLYGFICWKYWCHPCITPSSPYSHDAFESTDMLLREPYLFCYPSFSS